MEIKNGNFLAETIKRFCSTHRPMIRDEPSATEAASSLAWERKRAIRYTAMGSRAGAWQQTLRICSCCRSCSSWNDFPRRAKQWLPQQLTLLLLLLLGWLSVLGRKERLGFVTLTYTGEKVKGREAQLAFLERSESFQMTFYTGARQCHRMVV